MPRLPPCCRCPPAASHAAREASWSGFAAYCKAQIGKVEALAAEQADHKLHAHYRRSRVLQRFPGLYESLHAKAYGEWDEDMWGDYIAYMARAQQLPWDASAGALTADQKREMVEEVAAATGIPAEKITEAIEKKKAAAGGKAKAA